MESFDPSMVLNVEDIIITEQDPASLIVTFFFVKLHPPYSRQYPSITENIENYFQQFAESQQLPINELNGACGFYIGRAGLYTNLYVKRYLMVEGANDTFSVQFGLSATGSLQSAWASMNQFYTGLLQDWLSQEIVNANPEVRFLGYSLLYKATILEEHLYKQPSDDIIQLCQPIFNAPESTNYNLADHKFNNGKVSLLQVGKDPVFPPYSVYLALNVAITKSKMITDYFFQNNKQFLMIDAIVFKGDFQWRQLKGKKYAKLDGALDSLQKDAVELLKSVEFSVNNNQLEKVAGKYASILIPYADFKELELSLLKQVKNMSFKTASDQNYTGATNSIHNYHLDILTRKSEDSHLTLNRAELIFDQTKLAIEVSEAKQSKLSNINSGKIQLYLALFGIGLAVIQILDTDTIKGLLKAINYPQTDKSLDNYYGWHTIFLFKLLLSGLVVIISSCLYAFFRSIKPKKTRLPKGNEILGR